MPCDFRKTYTPCWTAETERLLKKHNKTGNPDVVQALIEALDTERLKCWKELVESTDFTHSSRKAWAWLRKLGAAENITAAIPSFPRFHYVSLLPELKGTDLQINKAGGKKGLPPKPPRKPTEQPPSSPIYKERH